MVAEYCGHSLSIRTAEIADYCESDVRRLASKFPRRCSPAPFRARNSVGIRGLAFAAQWLAYALPYRRFVGVLTDANARLGAER